MKIEVLFPEVANLYGDHFNPKYLAQCNSKIKLIHTSLTDEPTFLKEAVKMIYLGPMSETNQALVIDKLMPYKQKIKALIDDGIIFLVTGNALEVFGEYILDGKQKIMSLGIFKYHTIRDLDHRHNSLFLGTYEDIKLVGYKSQFSRTISPKNPFIKVIRGCGFNNDDDLNEGFNYHNFFGTYLLGPLFVINPLFTKKILRLLGLDDTLAFEKEAIKAYETRLKEYEDEKVIMMATH